LLRRRLIVEGLRNEKDAKGGEYRRSDLFNPTLRLAEQLELFDAKKSRLE